LDYSWNLRILWDYKYAFLNGVVVTLELAVLTAALATVFGVIVTFCRLSKFKLLRWLAAVYVEIFLALPLLVLMIWIYFALPAFGGVFRLSPFMAASLALIINLTPFISETLRAGFESIPKGYYLAGIAVGMRSSQIFRRITLPLVVRRTLPALITQYVSMLKLIALASVIAVPELLYIGNNIISREQRPLEVYSGVAMLYLVMIIPITLLSRLLEKRFVVRN
jgi:polar amino acid transport system permease protein